VLWQIVIHCVFVLSAIALAYTDRLMMTTANLAHAGGKSKGGPPAH